MRTFWALGTLSLRDPGLMCFKLRVRTNKLSQQSTQTAVVKGSLDGIQREHTRRAQDRKWSKREHQEDYFRDPAGSGLKVHKKDPSGSLFRRLGGPRAKSAQKEPSGNLFRRLGGPRAKSAQKGPPGAYLFRRLGGPKAKSAQKNPPGAYFGDSAGLGPKVLKKVLREPISATRRA